MPQVLVPSLRETDLHALLRATETSRQAEPDRCIVLLLLDTGLRLAEAAGLRVGLRVGDVDLIEGPRHRWARAPSTDGADRAPHPPGFAPGAGAARPR